MQSRQSHENGQRRQCLQTRVLAMALVGLLAVSLAPAAAQTVPAPVIKSFTASTPLVNLGDSATLAWEVTGATTLSIDNGVGAVTGTSVSVKPTETTAYTLTATNAAGESVESYVGLDVLDCSGLALCGPIHDAAKAGDLEKVRALLKGKPDLASGKDRNGLAPLHVAAITGHKDVAELLLANKADVDARDNGGWTPLHSVASGHKDVAELLLAHGADVNARSRRA